MASILRQLLVLAVLTGAAAWAIMSQLPAETEQAAGGGRPPPGVEAEAARAGLVERVVTAVGSGRALRSVELRFSDSGRISEILFDDGDAVEAGAALARMDDGAERAALAEAKAELSEAEAAYARASTLRDQGRVTSSSYDSAESEVLRARARLDKAEDDLDKRTLRAPFAGVVGFSETDLGAVVTTTTIIATLDDISQLDVEFSVPERYFGEVAGGAEVRARTRIFPDEAFDGSVAAIDRRVDEVSRAFRVRARFENPGLRLPAGAFMQVELVLESRQGVLAPEESLVTEAGQVHLFVVGEDGRVQKRAVTLGGRRAGDAEILEGLAAGEMVITRGVQKARDGAPVRLMEPKPEDGSGQVSDDADNRSAG